MPPQVANHSGEEVGQGLTGIGALLHTEAGKWPCCPGGLEVGPLPHMGGTSLHDLYEARSTHWAQSLYSFGKSLFHLSQMALPQMFDKLFACPE